MISIEKTNVKRVGSKNGVAVISPLRITPYKVRRRYVEMNKMPTIFLNMTNNEIEKSVKTLDDIDCSELGVMTADRSRNSFEPT